MNQNKKDIIALNAKVILENFHRVSKQLGMVTEKAEAIPTDLIPVTNDDSDDTKPTETNPVGKNPVGKNPVGKDGDSSVKSPTSSDVRSPTSTEVTSPTRTSTEVRSPTRTATSTDAYTSGNITVTGGAGAGATTTVTIMPSEKAPMDKTDSVSGAEYTKKENEDDKDDKDVKESLITKKKIKVTKEQYERIFKKK